MDNIDKLNLISILRVHGYLADVNALQPEMLIPKVITLKQSLGPAISTNSDKYQIDNGYFFVMLQVRGYHRFEAIESEPRAILGFLNLTPTDRVYLKTSNVGVRLETVNKGSQRFLGSNDVSTPLSSLISGVPGGAPWDLPVETPAVVGGSQILKATFDMIDTSTAANNLIGAQSTYGLIITGFMVPSA